MWGWERWSIYFYSRMPSPAPRVADCLYCLSPRCIGLLDPLLRGMVRVGRLGGAVACLSATPVGDCPCACRGRVESRGMPVPVSPTGAPSAPTPPMPWISVATATLMTRWVVAGLPRATQLGSGPPLCCACGIQAVVTWGRSRCVWGQPPAADVHAVSACRGARASEASLPLPLSRDRLHLPSLLTIPLPCCRHEDRRQGNVYSLAM